MYFDSFGICNNMAIFLAFFLIFTACLFLVIRYLLNWLATSYKFQLFGKMITCVDTDEKALALTYDDGPHPPYTDNLLDVFRELNAKATFFAIGKNVENNMDTARRMISEGHELGNHSYSHKKMVGTQLATIRTEIQKTDDIFFNLGIQSDIHFRAPFGLKRIRLPWELARRRKTNVLWNVDPKDYQSLSSEEIASFVIRNVKPGSIVLFHDGGGDRSKTVAATRMVVEQLQHEGYQFKTITELMALKA